MKLQQMLAARRRRRALLKIRREFARSGYPLDETPDVEIEAALPAGMCDSPPDYIGAKTISRALLRLPAPAARRSRGRMDEVVKAPGGHSRAGGLSYGSMPTPEGARAKLE